MHLSFLLYFIKYTSYLVVFVPGNTGACLAVMMPGTDFKGVGGWQCWCLEVLMLGVCVCV